MERPSDSRASVKWSRIEKEFAAADWDLIAVVPPSGGDLHPYPARFIPAIPGQALDVVRPDGMVLDPFVGSGTTLHEARKRGLPAVGNDLNPIACLIARVRTGEWTSNDNAAAQQHEHELVRAVRRGLVGARRLDIPRVDHWFDPWAQLALESAVSYLDTIPRSDVWHDRVALAISSSTVRLSRQESDTRYAAVNKPGDLAWAADVLGKAVSRVATWLKMNAVPGQPSLVLNGDARDLSAIADSSVSAAVFSPPYPNAYEYWLYHKYRMYWLGYDPIGVRKEEMGARPHYCRPNGLTEHDFAKQMREVFAELGRVMKGGTPIVVVIGDSVIGGRHIDNAELLSRAAESEGFSVHGHQKRIILRSRSSFNSAHSRGRKSEHVILYRSPL